MACTLPSPGRSPRSSTTGLEPPSRGAPRKKTESQVSGGFFRKSRSSPATSSAVARFSGNASSPHARHMSAPPSGSSRVASSCHAACGGWKVGFSAVCIMIVTACVSFLPCSCSCSMSWRMRSKMLWMSSVRFFTPSNMLKLAPRNSPRSRTPSPLVSAAPKAASSIQPSSKSSDTSSATTFWAEIHSSGERTPSPEASKSEKSRRKVWRMPAWYRGPIRARSKSARLVCSEIRRMISVLDKFISW
mmetsp:Transcript_13270/g.36547  ORF Transcript_13270/g.36547 Transcript_13270/m.36547 type:complete len:246 (+) Transcript_13270:777-1514(+)